MTVVLHLVLFLWGVLNSKTLVIFSLVKTSEHPVFIHVYVRKTILYLQHCCSLRSLKTQDILWMGLWKLITLNKFHHFWKCTRRNPESYDLLFYFILFHFIFPLSPPPPLSTSLPAWPLISIWKWIWGSGGPQSPPTDHALPHSAPISYPTASPHWINHDFFLIYLFLLQCYLPRNTT